MKSIKTLLATLAVVACAASAMAVQNQTIWVMDNGVNFSLSPVTSTLGAVTYSGSDASWSLVIASGQSQPPIVGQGTLSSPILDLSISATFLGGPSGASHPLEIYFAADGFGPTTGQFMSRLNNLYSGAGQTVTMDLWTAASPIPTSGTTPAAGITHLTTITTTSQGTSGNTSSGVTLAAPYALEEIVTIAGSTVGATYSLDALVTTVPDGGTTAILLGGALSVLGLIRRKLA